MGMALTGKVVPYKKGFGPFPADVYNVAFPNTYHGVSGEESLAALKALFKYATDASTIAAIIIEPVQGEGGFYHRAVRLPALAEDAVRRARHRPDRRRDSDRLCPHRKNVRARALRASRPTSWRMAKGLAGGLPLSAITGRADVMDASNPGGLGGTYAGNPVACAAAHAVLDAIEEEKLCDRANAIGKIILDRCNQIKARSNLNCVGDVRGLGAMCAIELVRGHRERRARAAVDPGLDESGQRERAHSAILRDLRQRYPLPRAAHRERSDRSRRHGHLRDEPHRSRDPGRVSS